MNSEHEIREGLADHETRLLYLENLHSEPSYRLPIKEEEGKPIATDNGLNFVMSHVKELEKQMEQLEGWRIYFQEKFNEHLDKSREAKSKKGYKYD